MDTAEAAQLRAELSRRPLGADGPQGRFRETLDLIPQIVWSSGADGELDYISDNWLALYGSRDTKDPIADFIAAIHQEDRKATLAAWMKSVARGDPFEAQFRIRHHSGAYAWVLARAQAKRDAEGGIVRWYGTCTDVQLQVQAQENLAASNDLTQGIVDASPDPISLLDLDGRILCVNRALLQGWESHGIEPHVGSIWGSRLSPEGRRRYAEAVAYARTGKMARFIMRVDRGKPVWWDTAVVPLRNALGVMTGLVAISRDVTSAKEAAEKAEWSANHDSLTGLPNRVKFQKHIEAAIDRQSHGTDERFTLLMMDVDGFKGVNDTIGHDAGDALLCAVADRLLSVVREGDVVARLGGDEFAVLLPRTESEEKLRALTNAILERLREPWSYDGRVVQCGVSIGATFFPAHASSRTELMKNADVALYAAKAAGKGNCKIFEPQMRAHSAQRSSLLALARDALREGALEAVFQPRVELGDRRLSGLEASARHSDVRKASGLALPLKAAAEDATLAYDVLNRLLLQVVSTGRAWSDEGLNFGRLVVSVPAAAFRHDGLADDMLDRLEKASLSPACLQIEVSENALAGRGADRIERALRTLGEAGTSIALSDFGTKVGSLLHLRQFPIDTIKLDGSFARSIDHGDSSMLRAVTRMALELGLRVVADGVQTATQHRSLVAAGCLEGQGRFYGQPMPASRAAKLLRAGTGSSRD